jgi:hypothetical protein
MEDKIYYILTDLLRDDISKGEAIGKLLVLCDVVKTLLCDDNIEKMANEYTGGQEDYQAFVLACNVIAEKIGM